MSKNIGPRYCDWKDKKYSEDFLHRIDTNVDTLIDQAYVKVRSFMVKKKSYIEKLAKELLEKETVIKNELDDLWLIRD